MSDVPTGAGRTGAEGEHVRRPPDRPSDRPAALPGWRAANELVGLLLLPALVFCAVTGLAVWYAVASQPRWSLPLITAHAYVGLAGLVLLLAKLVAGTAAWRRRVLLERRSGRPRAGQHLLTALLVGAVLVLFTSGVLLNANATPGGNAAYKSVHLYAALATVALVAQHLLRHLVRARRVVARTVSTAPPAAVDAGRRHVLLAGGLGVLAWGALRTTRSTLETATGAGPNDFPVTLTAGGADQPDARTWSLRVDGDVRTPLVVDLADLRAAELREARYSLDCVTGWSATRTWGGVSVQDLLDRAGPTGELLSAVFVSTTGYEVALLREQLTDRRTMIAFQTDGVDLTPEHGFPGRVMAPGVIGEKCLKWVERITVVCA